MSMVDRYKKTGGFLQLVQVIETCGTKKREQFMNIITEESPQWAEALNQKCLSFEKIISWKPEILLEILATVNPLAMGTALKGLEKPKLDEFMAKLSHQESKKLENSMKEINPNPNEISSSMMKVVSETRNLMTSNALKADKIDPNLVIPDEFESKLEKKHQSKDFDLSANILSDIAIASPGGGGGGSGGAEVEKLQKKLILLSKEVQNLKQENILMKDKLDKIKKIA
jgi:FliG C-terminal domain